jgi:hypothetical protein
MDRKQRIREYKQTPRPAGVYVVRNTVSDTLLIGRTPDLPGMLNRQRFQLEAGSHPDRELQHDWDELGPSAFEFSVLDELDQSDEPQSGLSEDLLALHQMWLATLVSSKKRLYALSTRGVQRTR